MAIFGGSSSASQNIQNRQIALNAGGYANSGQARDLFQGNGSSFSNIKADKGSQLQINVESSDKDVALGAIAANSALADKAITGSQASILNVLETLQNTQNRAAQSVQTLAESAAGTFRAAGNDSPANIVQNATPQIILAISILASAFIFMQLNK